MARYSTAGMTLQRSTDGTTYVTVAQVASYEITGAAKEQIEATALNDTARQYVDGLPGFGQMNMSLFWDPSDTGHQALFNADFSATNVSRYWKLTHPASGTTGDMTFQGPVVGYSQSRGANAVDTASFTVQISGAITLATS